MQKYNKEIQEELKEDAEENIKKEKNELEKFLENKQIYFNPPFLQINNEYIKISKIDKISIFEDCNSVGLYSSGCIIGGFECNNIEECLLLINIIIELTKGE